MSSKVLGSHWAVWAFFGLVACGGKAQEIPDTRGHQEAGAAGATVANAGAPNAGAPDAGAPNAGTGGGITATSCTVNTDCTLRASACCSCGLGPLSDYAALNVAYADEFSADRCAPGTACGACPPIAPGFDNPTAYYIATCKGGQCTPLDLRETPVTECNTDADCSSRAGSECCDACDSSPTLSINASRSTDLQSLLCGPSQAKCKGCTRVTTGVGVFSRCVAGQCTLWNGCNQCF